MSIFDGYLKAFVKETLQPLSASLVSFVKEKAWAFATKQLKQMPWTKRRIDQVQGRAEKALTDKVKDARNRIEEHNRQVARKELIREFASKAAHPDPDLNVEQSRLEKASPKKVLKTGKKIATEKRQQGKQMNKTIKPQFKAAAQGAKKSAPPPRLSLAGGPKPPGSVANAVNRQVRQSQSQSHAMKSAKAPTLTQQSITQKFNQASAKKSQSMTKGGIKR